MMATKKSPAKKASKKTRPAAKKPTAPKEAAMPARKTSSRKSRGALHSVARSIGATLGSLAKKTSEAVDAAKQALPSFPGTGSDHSEPQ